MKFFVTNSRKRIDKQWGYRYNIGARKPLRKEKTILTPKGVS